MVVGVPNVGKSALINSIHQIASSRFPGKIFFIYLFENMSYFIGTGIQLMALTYRIRLYDSYSHGIVAHPNSLSHMDQTYN